MTKLKIAATAALAACALATAGVLAAGAGQADDPPQAALKPPPQAGVGARPEPTATKPLELVEVKGRVLDADGQAVAGATVRGVYFDRNLKSFREATSDATGQFSIRLPQTKFDTQFDADRAPWLLASKPGHGVGWTEGALRRDQPAELIVKLTPEGPPIEGRLIDLEGRPLPGVRVEVQAVWYESKGDMAGWIARARNGAEGTVWQGLDNLPIEDVLKIEATTGLDGRFRLTGVGRDRFADLLFSGPGVATTEAFVMSLPEPELRAIDKSWTPPQPFVAHAPKFQLALAPSKRVEGVARDQDTGRPIAGIEIKASPYDENSLIPSPGIRSTTDADGRYRFDGLPKAEAYRLYLEPGPGLPYFNTNLKAPAESPGLDAVTFDFGLKRAMIVRGKVTDKLTGRPVRGHVSYYGFDDNPLIRDHPGIGDGNGEMAYIQADGNYELVALAGHGIIAVRAEEERHRGSVGADKIPGYDQEHGSIEGTSCGYSSYHILTEVNFDANNPNPTVDFQADSGLSVAIDVVDPDGQPLGETIVKGKADLFRTSPYKESAPRVEIHALDPAHPRRVVITHEARKLIGSAYLRGDEVGPIVVKLQPWGTITGRIIDDEGQPGKGMFLRDLQSRDSKNPELDDILPWADWNQGLRIGDDGRFRVEGLVPGLKYKATASNTRMNMGGALFHGVTVGPGEVKNLGDLKVQPSKED